MARKQQSAGILSYLGIAFIGYLLFSNVGAAAYSRIAFGRPRVRFSNLNWDRVDVSLEIPVTNNNPISLPVDGLLGQLIYGQYTLLPFRLSNPITIQAGETTNVPFSGVIRFAEIGGNLAALFTSGEILQTLRVSGNAYIKGAVIPFDNPISIG